MSYMTLAAVASVLAFFVPLLFGGQESSSQFPVSLIQTLAHLGYPTPIQIISFASEVLSLAVLVLSPVVLFSVTNTWSSLSRWRRSFLRFAIMSNIESVAFETEDPRDRLFEAILAANPDYERILDKTEKILRSERTDATVRALPMNIFKNVTIGHRRRAATFDVLIGHRRRAATFDVLIGYPPGSMRKTSLVSANQLLKTRTISNALRALSSIGITAGRVFEGKPTVRSYIEFAEDLKLLASYAGSPVIRGFLVYRETPPSELLYYANDKNNWPRHRLVRIPIVVLVQQENGYEVVVLAS
jgi:hypothetical protein